MEWLYDQIMWFQFATGAFGMLTCIQWWRILCRKLGHLPSITAYFSPRGGCQDAIVRELNAARHEILVQAYSFTADPLTFVLVDAKKKGIVVEIVLDKSNEVEKYSDLHILLEQGMDVMIDHSHAIAHNKIIIIDRKTLITGSFNFTNQAEHENAENLLILKGNPELIGHYRENFFKHRDHSKLAVMRTGTAAHSRGQAGHKAA